MPACGFRVAKAEDRKEQNVTSLSLYSMAKRVQLEGSAYSKQPKSNRYKMSKLQPKIKDSV